MNYGEGSGGVKLDAREDTKQVLDQWVESLAQVLESMTDQRPEVRWEPASGAVSEATAASGAGAEAEILWWEQPFQIEPRGHRLGRRPTSGLGIRRSADSQGGRHREGRDRRGA